MRVCVQVSLVIDHLIETACKEIGIAPDSFQQEKREISNAFVSPQELKKVTIRMQVLQTRVQRLEKEKQAAKAQIKVLKEALGIEGSDGSSLVDNSVVAQQKRNRLDEQLANIKQKQQQERLDAENKETELKEKLEVEKK